MDSLQAALTTRLSLQVLKHLGEGRSQSPKPRRTCSSDRDSPEANDGAFITNGVQNDVFGAHTGEEGTAVSATYAERVGARHRSRESPRRTTREHKSISPTDVPQRALAPSRGAGGSPLQGQADKSASAPSPHLGEDCQSHLDRMIFVDHEGEEDCTWSNVNENAYGTFIYIAMVQVREM